MKCLYNNGFADVLVSF